MLHLRFIGAALCAMLMLLTQSTVVHAGTTTAQAKPATAGPAPTVLIKTSAGEIVVELDPAKAPKTVDNFLQYVKAGFYNGTVFHRVIRGFMIQGGGYTPQGSEKATRGPIEIESSNGLKNRRYAIAMARTADPNSATAQFFINTKDNRFLDYPGQDGFGYAVFGKVIKGSEVVDQIEAVDTDRRDKPIKPVIIESATLVD
ncbi:MAG: peptidyl-prolyl cis-trans isomerase [Burkholderiaceae bacterium]|jgi:cyclophilin family peptidyl-prolyl cis-trans isomerase|nr:peptidyl-prolyl cis-trans isomerase [Burkholderiaceae bacterium]